ncbi:FecR family protein [Azospira restricta]|uniref:FecR domain-containing protein n=1 Tax=Azospira restricta TaxID=404405 RepID=A0A974PX63_9RHOO|nr:FecR domain-containing protein [Azospira restricta]QRJ62971.1 FecR domain-containing protein [Azospira restricta]
MKIPVFLWLLAASFAAWAEPNVAGRIEASDGDARIYDAAKAMRPAAVGELVREGDSVVTGADGEVHLAMEDEGQIAIRPNTRMRIAKYRAEGGSGDSSVIALVQGALRSVTGWIGKYNPKGYTVRTPTATIGVRGTDHETRVIPEGSSEGEAGTYDKVNQGATVLSTAQGRTEIRPNQAGFVALSGKARPRVLAAVPTFFAPARFDRRFENLHERVRERLDVRRNERIESFKERRRQLGERAAQQHGERLRAQEANRAGPREQWQERQRERREKREAGRLDNLRGESGGRRFDERSPGDGRRFEPGKRGGADERGVLRDGGGRGGEHRPGAAAPGGGGAGGGGGGGGGGGPGGGRGR